MNITLNMCIQLSEPNNFCGGQKSFQVNRGQGLYKKLLFSAEVPILYVDAPYLGNGPYFEINRV